jgi:hypothetical protein
MVFRQRRNVVAAMVNMALPNTMEGRSHQIRANEVRLCVNASKSPNWSQAPISCSLPRSLVDLIVRVNYQPFSFHVHQEMRVLGFD